MINYGLLIPLNNSLDKSFQTCFTVGGFRVKQILSHFKRSSGVLSGLCYFHYEAGK